MKVGSQPLIARDGTYMNKNLKISLIAVLCIVTCGLVVSYKSFRLSSSLNRQNNVALSQEVSGWIGETIDQKVMQMESSVAYLDKSTVESLKRFGARYFAYAHKENNEWSIKWKQLGDFNKDQIHAEVKKLEFDKLSMTQRAWFTNEKNQPIFVSPVELANSIQLKNGFLIFGLDDSFFGFIQSKDDKVALVSKALQPIHHDLPKAILEDKDLFRLKDLGLGSRMVEQGGETRTLTSYFSPTAQLFIVHQQDIANTFYLGSPFFTYFLLAAVLMLVAYLFLTNSRFPQSETSSRYLSQWAGDVASWTGGLKQRYQNARAAKTAIPSSLEDLNAGSDQDEVIADFGDFLDDILTEEQVRLKKLGISVKTQFAEGARVFATPPYIKDFMKRLIGNSIVVLENHKNKAIQVQLVEQTDSYQLLYLDTRMENFPTGEEPSLLLQTEGSMVGIDGIIAYASWLFGNDLNVAKNGFCLSLNVVKAGAQVVEAPKVTTPQVVDNVVFESDADEQRIEITDDNIDTDIMDSLNEIENFKFTKPVETAKAPATSEDLDATFKQGSIDEIIENFSLKELDFSEPTIAASQPDVPTDEKGLFEFNSGKFKIKIRTPKKRNMDVDG